MKRLVIWWMALAAVVAAQAPLRAAQTVKYEFTRDSANSTLTGGTKDFCGAGSWVNPGGGVSFTDPSVAGATVTFQVGFSCQSATTNLTVNTLASGSLGGSTGGCCSGTFQTYTSTITAAYNNGASTKTITSTFWGGSLTPLTGLFNTTDPMFRIIVTLIPGVSTPTSGGFTNQTLPLFGWPAMPGAGSYQLQVSTDPFFNTPMILDQTAIPGPSYQLTIANTLANGVSYYTRVRAAGGAYNGNWSYITDFTVAQSLPSVPTLVSPPNGGNVPTQTPTFNWNPVTVGPE